MSELTKRLREGNISEWYAREREAADRIEALEECLRGIMVEWDGYGIADSSLTRAIDKARALLEESQTTAAPPASPARPARA